MLMGVHERKTFVSKKKRLRKFVSSIHWMAQERTVYNFKAQHIEEGPG